MYPSYKINADWSRLAKQIVKSNQTVIVIGTTDSGKSTFCRFLIDFACTAGMKVGFVDTDVGQSQIGPPTTIGMQIYQPIEIESEQNFLEQYQQSLDISDSLYFVGDTSPHRSLLYVLSGTRLMVEAVYKQKTDFNVIDTSGYLHVSLGWQLKQQKIEIIQPQHIVCIGRKAEFEHIVGYNDNFNNINIHYLLPHKDRRIKSRIERTEYRNEKFKSYFKDASHQQLAFNQIRGVRTLFFNGRMAIQRELQILTDLAETEIEYAEWGHRNLKIVTPTIISEITSKKIKDHLSLLHINIQKPDFLDNILVGMLNEDGKTIGLGKIVSTDFQSNVLNILCKTGLPENTKVLQFSNYRYSEID
ncbi:hypothetical protein JT359_03375 [Candidatus Poribacteria bacterium]|nr:hypothetical protein [Candidatus Poribacteria bacterium]